LVGQQSPTRFISRSPRTTTTTTNVSAAAAAAAAGGTAAQRPRHAEDGLMTGWWPAGRHAPRQAKRQLTGHIPTRLLYVAITFNRCSPPNRAAAKPCRLQTSLDALLSSAETPELSRLQLASR